MKFFLDQAVAVLERTPVALRELLQDLPDDWVSTSGDRSNWGPFDVVGHLIHGEQTDWIPRARIILDLQERVPFTSFDREAQFELSTGKTLADLLGEFEELRRENLVTLQGWNLAPEALNGVGEHPELGPVTLRELLATWVVHDLGHLAQITRSMARRYNDEVGPWREYLPVLQERPS